MPSVVMSLQRFKVIRTALVAKGAVDPPVPVPNTVVKRSSTYNTAGSTSVGRSAAASAVPLFLYPFWTAVGLVPLPAGNAQKTLV